jgi:hypothetical protein
MMAAMEGLTDVFRILVVIFLAMHGLGHLIWFLGAWTSVIKGIGEERWSLPGDVTIQSPIGRVWGLVALAALLAFLGAGAALFSGSAAWRTWTYLGIVLSFVAVAPWRRQSPGSTWLFAILADIVLLFLLALPLSVEMLQAS